MRGPVIFSIIFHLAAVAFFVIGIPHIRKPPPTLSDPIPVEIVEVGEMTTTTRPPVKAPPTPEKREVPVEKKEDKPPTPPKVTAKEPPKVVPPEPPKLKEEVVKEKKPDPPAPPPPEDALEPAPKPPPPKEEKKAEPAKEEPKKEITEDQQQDFASLLRNLQESQPQVEAEAPVNPEAAPPAPAPVAPLAQRLTMSEADALRRQLTRCWSIQAGARYAEDLVVEIRLGMNMDRTVNSAVIVDQFRYNQDGFFRAAADSAMRAVRSPLCNPLDLPPDKYEGWRDIVVTFDPREML